MSEPSAEKRLKRANAEGSVFLWAGRGWYAAVSGPDGRRIMRKAPKQTEKGAEALLRQLLNQRDSGALTRGATTLAEFKEEWLRACKRRGVRQTSLDSYRQKFERYVEPALGKKRLDRVTTGDVEKLYDRLADAGLSPASILAVHVRLHNLLKLAKRRKLVGQVVTELVDPPSVPKYEARTLAIEELRALHAAVEGHLYGPVWTLIAETGARFGQAAGLRLQDVDLERRVARSRKAVKHQKVEGRMVRVIGAVKTDAGRVEWSLTRRAVAALEAQLERRATDMAVAGDRWQDPVDEDGETAELVFANTRGGMLHDSHVRDAWHELLRSIGLEGEGKPRVRMHDLRHSKGTVMADEGEDLVVIQRTLGHAKSSITADLYVGRVPKALRKAADRWDALLDGEAPAVIEGTGEASS